jgi:hypothetical protein
MSLDVWLTVNKPVLKSGTGVYVRQNGKRIELSAKEVAEQFEGAEIQPQEYESNEVFDANITHNLGQMANKAGLYYALWRPEERQYYKAKDLITPLTRGLKKLKANPDTFKAINPDNGWGSYDDLVQFTGDYLETCKQYPEAEIGVSR